MAEIKLTIDEALHKAVALHRNGELQNAEELYRSIIGIQPSNPDANHNFGVLLVSTDRLDEALVYLRQAIKSNRAVAQFWKSYLDTLLKKEDFETAKNCIFEAEAAGLDGGLIDAMEYRLVSQATFKTIIKIIEALFAAYQYNKVVSIAKKATERFPTEGFGWKALASAEGLLGRYEEALDANQKAASLMPLDSSIYENMGIIYKKILRIEEAKNSFQKALELKPTAVNAILGLADLANDSGNFDVAAAFAEKALEINPNSLLATAIIAMNRKMDKSRDERWIKRAKKIVSDKNARVYDRYTLLFAMGKYYDDVGEYDNAFGRYKDANELKKTIVQGYEYKSTELLVDILIKNYTAEVVCSQQPSSYQSKTPLFILGMPRSGTSLTEQIIASHPMTFGAGELLFWSATARKYQKQFLSASFDEKMISSVAKDGLAMLEGLAADAPNALRIVDKMPYNYKYIGLIHAIFPNAKIIHTMRNPIDTCLSIYFQNFDLGHTYANDLEDLAHYYRQYRRLMEHWRSVLPEGIMLDVKYEDIVEDQEGWSRKIIEHIGLEWDEECLEFHKTERRVGTASNWQVKQPIYKSSKERWRNYEKHIGTLLPLLEGY